MIALPGPFSAGNGSLGEPGLIPGPFWTPTPNLPAQCPPGAARTAGARQRTAPRTSPRPGLCQDLAHLHGLELMLLATTP